MIEWKTFSANGLFAGADTAGTESSGGIPFFTFAVNVVAGPSGAVEESSSSAGQWGQGANSVIKIVSSCTLGTFGERVESFTTNWVGNTLSVFLVITCWARVLDTCSVNKGVSCVTSETGTDG